MTPRTRSSLFFLLFMQSLCSFAQLAGSYTVPGSFSSLANAISSLNIGGVTGPVTINIQAGYTETVIAGGYSLYTVPGASSVNAITFRKSGSGTSPNFVAYSGTRYAYQNTQDGMWRLIGADYITIEDLTFSDYRTTNQARMEFGIAMFRANAYDGCQYNTIRNCTFSLKRENNESGSGIGVPGSRGIEITGATSQNHTMAVVPLSLSGSHRFNVITSNLIQNCNFCIALTASYSTQGALYIDADNVIGGLTAAAGNTISGYGSSSMPYYPAGGIYYEGQQRLTIQSNSISSLPSTGFAHTDSDLYGIRGKNNNYDISIVNNTLSVRGTSDCMNLYCIRNEGLSSFPISSYIKITGNRFVNCQLSYQFSTSFHGITNSVEADTLIMSSNTFTQSSTFCGGLVSLIRNSGQVASHAAFDNNVLSISAQAATTVNLIYHNGSPGTPGVSASGNIFRNLVLGSGTTAFQANFISVLGTNRTLAVNSNTFLSLSYDNTGTSNLILNSSSTSSNVMVNANSVTGYTATQWFYGHQIYFYRGNGTLSSPASTVQVSNNTITSVTGLGSSLYAITTAEGPVDNCSRKLIFNNSFTNMSGLSNFRGVDANRLGDANGSAPSSIHNNTITNVFGGNYCVGIEVGQFTGSLSLPPEVRANVIYSLTGQTTNTGGLWGIRATAGGGMTIAGNIVSNVANTTTFTCAGISVVSGTAATDVVNIYNNIVSRVANSGQITFYGSNAAMSVTGGSRFNVYHNTIYLNSSVPMGYVGLGGMAPNVDSRNNLIVNYATGNGYGNRSTCIGGATNYHMASNNNFFSKLDYQGIMVTAPSTEYITMNAFRAAVQGREKNSVLDTIIFASTTFTSPGFMAPSPTVPTLVESGGTPVSWITTDIYGNPRNPNTPDIGAIEGNFIRAQTDSLPPVISGLHLTSSPCGTSLRTLTVQISDHSGVATGSLSPRVYYQVNSGGYTSTPGVLTSGTSSLGVYSFTLSYSVVPGDVVSWFLIAQDSSSAQNVSSWPPVGLNAQSVNNVSVFPTPETYTVYTSLGGTYTVGAGGTFTSLTQAADAYNSSCLTGPVTFVLTNSLYTIPAETFPIVFERNADASATNSLLVIPAPGNSVTVSTGTQLAPISVIKFRDARHIAFDGNNSNAGIAVTCSVNTSAWSALFWLASSNTFTGGCSHIRISGVDLFGSHAEQCYGVLATASHTSNLNYTGGAFNNSITINGNRFSTLRRAIFARGLADLSTLACSSWMISGNHVGPVTGSAAQNLSREGLVLQNTRLFSILSNTISNITSAFSAPLRGIELAAGTSSCTIAYNTIRSMSMVPTSYEGLIGINVRGNTANADILIHNNVIADLTTLSSQNFEYGGIVLGDYSDTPGGIRIHNNSISLGSTALTSSLMSVSGCIVLSSNPNIEIRNNILHNDVQNSGSATRRNYCVYLGSSSLAFPLTYFDHNNFSAGAEASLMGSSSSYSTLAAVQNVSGQNYNSTAYTPSFVSLSDLHIDPSVPSNALLKNKGASISLYSNDIDNDPRNTTAPDPGADEFTAATCTSAAAGTVSPAAYSICSTSTINLTPGGLSGGAGTVYQWQHAATSGGTFSNITAGTGITSPQYNTGGQLSPGIYYIRLSTSCPNVSVTSVSNEVTLTVVPAPTLNVSQSHTAVCAGSSVTLTASGALTYSWSTGATTPSVVVTPSVSTFYSVSYSSSPCGAGISNPITIVAAPAPTLTITSPSSVCAGATATLSAGGATSYSWSNGWQTGTIVPTVTATTVFTVTGTNNGGCSSIAVRTVQALPSPTITVAGASSVCAGQTATLVASGAGTYTWSNSVFSATNIVTPGGTVIYTVSGTAAGCTSSLTHTLNVVSPAPVTVSGNTVICSGQSTTLTASGYPNFTWAPGGASASIVASPTVNTSYTVTGTGNCSNTAVINVNVNGAPQLTVSGPAGACLGEPVTLTVSGANTFTWSDGSQAASFSLTISGNTLITVAGTSSGGCTGAASHSITAVALPQLTVSPASSTVCALSPASFTASGAATYSWSPGSTGAVLNFAPAASAIITVTGTSNGCSTTQTVAVTTKTLPTISVSPPAATVCAQSNVSFTASGAGTYTWSHGGGNNNSVTYQALVSQVYTVSGTDAMNGCVSSQTIPVTTNSLPVIAVFGPTSLCAGQSATLLATGASNYLWNTTATTPFAVVSPASTSAYLVIGTAPNGCSSSTGHTITVAAVPSVTILPASATVCANSSTVFTASGANSFVWTNGPSTASITVTPAAPAMYTVTGTTNGCSSSQTVAVSTLSLPAISLSPPAATVCATSPVSFTASGAGSYTWSHGGGNSASVSFTASSSSVYSVSGTDSVNGCTATAIAGVTTNTLPVISATGNTSLCAGESATLTASGAATYSWSTGSAFPQLIFTPGASTLLVITGTNAAGCTGSGTVNVSVAPLPTVQALSSSTAVCAWTAVTLSAMGANTYSWSTGQTGSLVVVSPSVTTNYTVTGTSIAGCKSAATVTVSVMPAPSITVSASAFTVCPSTAVTFTASGASNYSWTGNATGTNVSFFPSSTTIYTVTGLSTTNGCPGTQSVQVSAFAPPVLTVSGNTAVCSGSSTTLTASGAFTYTWNTGGNSASEVLSPGGNLQVIVTGTNANGCVGSSSLSVISLSLPVVSISGTGTLCEGSDGTLTATGANSYSWSTATTTSSITISPVSNTVYSVTGTASNGCSATASASVTVNSPPSLSLASTHTSACAGQQVTLTASGGSTYTWSTGGTGTSVVVSAPSATVYSVSSSVNGCTGQASISVAAAAAPVLTVSPGAVSVCPLTPVSLTVSGAGTYTWNGLTTGNVFTLAPAGTTVITVNGMSSASGCTAAMQVTVGTFAAPVITISGPTVLCSGMPGTWQASGAGSYSWMNGQNTAAISFTPSSSAVITLTGTSAQSCTGTASLAYTVQPAPMIAVSPASLVACDDDSVSLAASGAAQYTWMPGNATGTTFNPPPGSGVYSVTGADAFGCPGDTALAEIVRDTCTSIRKISAWDGLEIFPNPSTGRFELRAGQEKNRLVQVYNTIGLLIMEEKMARRSQVIDLSRYDKGVYTVIVTTGSYKTVNRVILY